MKVLIYNTNSFGGNFNYSVELAKAYRLKKEVESCLVLSPPSRKNDIFKKDGNFLLSDESPFANSFLKKVYFLVRSVINPFRLFRFLKSYPDAVVIFNDYDQVSAPLWAPMFKSLRRRHFFSVILHDPDRDNYFPSKSLSEWTMTKFMAIVDVAFYHELLPDKPYYSNVKAKVKVPHGLYFHHDTNVELLKTIKAKKKDKYIIAILGNVRAEKNYELAISALNSLPDVMLLVAGAASNSRISIQQYKDKIEELGLSRQVLWIDKFLSDAEMQAAITSSDILLMCYKAGFTSQSGILNLIAPYKKNIIVGDTPSALQKTVADFSLGRIIPLTTQAFIQAVKDLKGSSERYHAGWEKYLKYASWESHVEIAMNFFTVTHADIRS